LTGLCNRFKEEQLLHHRSKCSYLVEETSNKIFLFLS
jgi:hypothetical protein